MPLNPRRASPLHLSSNPTRLGQLALLPQPLRLTCRRLGIRPTPYCLLADLSRQTLWALRKTPHHTLCDPIYQVAAKWIISSSRHGIGQIKDSNKTPLGLHQIRLKIGQGWPVGAVFRHRQFQGYIWQGVTPNDIAHRIFWLSGLEPGWNLGGSVDTFERYIYIHGFGDETTLGKPKSIGCLHVSAKDLIPWFDRIPASTLVWISPILK